MNQRVRIMIIQAVHLSVLKRAGQAAVNHQHLARHVSAVVRRQEDDCTRHIFWVTGTGHWHMTLLDVPRQEVLSSRLVHAVDYRHWRAHEARRYRIGGGIIWCKLDC